MFNLELRQLIMAKGLRYWEIARALGIHPNTLSLWLREELGPEQRKKIEDAIKQLS